MERIAGCTGVKLKVLAIAQVRSNGCDGFDCALLDNAIWRNNRKLQRLVIKELVALGPGPQVEKLRILNTVCANNFNRPVDFIESAQEMFFKSAGEVRGVLNRGLLGTLAFSS